MSNLFNATERNNELGGESEQYQPKKEKSLDDKIREAQAFNLAVALITPHINDIERNEEYIKSKILQWQKWFAEELLKTK